jgi:hypothetical protein
MPTWGALRYVARILFEDAPPDEAKAQSIAFDALAFEAHVARAILLWDSSITSMRWRSSDGACPNDADAFHPMVERRWEKFDDSFNRLTWRTAQSPQSTGADQSGADAAYMRRFDEALVLLNRAIQMRGYRRREVVKAIVEANLGAFRRRRRNVPEA